jgi:hypothetical protein
MTETLMPVNQASATAPPPAIADALTAPPAPEQNAISLYDAYWQARSGFFNLPAPPGDRNAVSRHDP